MRRNAGAGPLADYEIGQRVMTREGYPGVITDIHEGPSDLTTYWVTLDGGQGGGEYAEAEIWPEGKTTAASLMVAMENTAAQDYPELSEILSERLPPTTASNPDGPDNAVAECGNCGTAFSRKTLIDSDMEGCPECGADALKALSLTGAAKHLALYLPMVPPDQRGSGNTPLTPEEKVGYQEGFSQGQEGITRSPSRPLESAFMAGFDLGWAEGVLTYRQPPNAWDARDLDNEQIGGMVPNRLPYDPTSLGSKHASEEKTAGWFHNLTTNPGNLYSIDWCRYRRSSHCYLPKGLDKAASKEAGYAVWIPEDRGNCPRIQWREQEACPVAQPGPRSNEAESFTDATVPYSEGGQHGGLIDPNGPIDNTAHPGNYDPRTSSVNLGMPAMPKTAGIKTASQTACPICGDIMLSQVAGMMCMMCGTLIPFCSTENLYVISDDGLLAEQRAKFERTAASERPEYVQDRSTNNIHVRGDDKEDGTPTALCNKRYRVYTYENPEDKSAQDDFHEQFSTWGKCQSCDKKHNARTGSLARTANWRDVQAKAKRIRTAGGVRLVAHQDGTSVAHVQGDHGVYETEVVVLPGTRQIGSWSCGCKWASYAWGRSGPYKIFEGRLCSHSLALTYEIQARGMFGRPITLDEKQPAWMDQKHVHRPGDYDRSKKVYTSLERTASSRDLPQTGPLSDDYWGAGGCGKLALAFVTLYPEMKIAVEWGDGHDEGLVSHCCAYDPSGRAFDFNGTSSDVDDVLGFFGGRIEKNVKPERVAESMRIRWSAEEPWEDDGVYEASEVIAEHWGEHFDHTASRPTSISTEPWFREAKKTDTFMGKVRGLVKSLFIDDDGHVKEQGSQARVDHHDVVNPAWDPRKGLDFVHHGSLATWDKTALTLYRGEGDHATQSYYPKTGPDALAGAWWTESLESATQYARSAKGRVYTIDVDLSEAERRGAPGYYVIVDPKVRERRSLYTGSKTARKDTDPPEVSGVFVKATDTGRILMIQRSMDDKTAPGTWEAPGGHHEDGDLTSLHAAIREWEEEIGQPFPEGGHVEHTWRSPNGVYQGHLVVIPKESDVVLHAGRTVDNPDDPDKKMCEQAAWWTPEHAKKNPAIRPETKTSTPWPKISATAKTASLVKHADEDQCPFCAGDSLMENGHYVCEEGHQWNPDETVAQKYHGDGPERGLLQEFKMDADVGPQGLGFSLEPSYDYISPNFFRAGSQSDQPKEGSKMDMFPDEFGSMFDDVPLGVTADLHDEPEPALPSTDGGDDYTGSWQEHADEQDADWWSGDDDTAMKPTSSLDAAAQRLAAALGVVHRSSAPARAHQAPPAPVHAGLDGRTALAYADALARGEQPSGPNPFAHLTEGAVDNETAAAAQDFLARTALKTYTANEREEIIGEGELETVGASNTDRMNIKGTHYESMISATASSDTPEDEDLWMLDGDPNGMD